MAGEVKLAEVILNHAVDGTIDQLNRACAAEENACAGVVISDAQEEIIEYVLHDGKVTDREKTLLGFLPSEVVSGIAGHDGMHPARLMVTALVRKLAHAKPEGIPSIVEELSQLDPAVRATVEPEVRKTLEGIEQDRSKAESLYAREKATYDRNSDRMYKQIKALADRIEAAQDKYNAMQDDGYRRINNMDLSHDGSVRTSMVTALEQQLKSYYSTRVQPLRDQATRIRKQLDKLDAPSNPKPVYDAATSALTSYLEGSSKASPTKASPSILSVMTLEELDAQVRELQSDDAFLVMLKRFPQDEKTIGHCARLMRSSSQAIAEATKRLEDANARFRGGSRMDERSRNIARDRFEHQMKAIMTNPASLAALEHIGRFRARLAPIIDDIPTLFLPKLLASNPKENVSDLIIARIMSAEKHSSWKLAALAGAAEKADHVTFDRIVAAVENANLEYHFRRDCHRYRRMLSIASSIEASTRNETDREIRAVRARNTREIASTDDDPLIDDYFAYDDASRLHFSAGGSYHDIAERKNDAAEQNKGYGAHLLYDAATAPLHFFDRTVSLGIGGGFLVSRAASDYEPRKNASSSGFTDIAGVHAAGLLGIDLSDTFQIALTPHLGYYHVSHGYRQLEEGGDETSKRSMSEGKFGYGSDVSIDILFSEKPNYRDGMERMGLSLTYGLTQFRDIGGGSDNNGDGKAQIISIGLANRLAY